MLTSNASVGIEEILRQQLISGEITPGTWLRESALAERLGVSRTPVREAFTRLSRDGLLEWRQRRGYRAMPLDREELDAAYPVLIALEVVAIERLVRPLDDLIQELRAPLVLLSRHADSVSTLSAADIAWHRRLVAGAQNTVLSETHEKLVERVARYIVAYWRHRTEIDRSDLEHERVVEALEHGDARLAAALLQSHRTQGLERIHRIMLSQETE